MKCLFRGRKAAGRPPASLADDAEVARLTARADLIVEELDIVVRQMSDMLRKPPGKAHE